MLDQKYFSHSLIFINGPLLLSTLGLVEGKAHQLEDKEGFLFV